MIPINTSNATRSDAETTAQITIKSGVYRHYKGLNYAVFGVARHSETEEAHVVYQCLYGNYDLWIRPLSMFKEQVTVDGESFDRFSWIAPLSDEMQENNR